MTNENRNAPRHNQPWTDEEIEAAVKAYAAMFQRHLMSDDIRRSETIDALLTAGLKDRNRKAAEFRLCNISHVHSTSPPSTRS